MDMDLLNAPVTVIKGIGQAASEKLATVGAVTVNDLLNYFPFRYEDRQAVDVLTAAQDDKITVVGLVQTVPVSQFYGKTSRLTFKLLTGQNLISVTVFNQNYLKNKLQMNMEVLVSGKWDRNRRSITASRVQFNTQVDERNRFEPVYHLKGDLQLRSLRKWIELALHQVQGQVRETLPASLCAKYKLTSREEALRYLHFPKNEWEVKQGRRRFIYEEFLQFQLKMLAFRKMNREQFAGIAQDFDQQQIDQFTAELPFQLTKGQEQAVADILLDLKAPQQMNRLLQGDVGAGKTVVAAIAALASVTAGYQVALMAPTEILAEQHFASLQQLFANQKLQLPQPVQQLLDQDQLQLALLTSSSRGKARNEVLAQLESGELHLVIGTHALLQEDVHFRQLGLVITDEQHRFGVAQRKVLQDKGTNPDVLFMTATPIPRTLAITAFGEMDVTVIKELPAGRKEIKTRWVKHEQIDKVLAFLLQEVKKGRQAYVICPLIEESENFDYGNAVDVHAQLMHYFGDQCVVGLMHGKLSSAEKDQMMQDFLANRVQILVSTTVVEVGVNVPNATCMVIYDAERFGLSQLHQLRGRVGRGSEQSYCILMADPKNEVALERLTIMTETNDGFYLSERDLALRGPGDFFGHKQSGVPEFKVGDMVQDFNILEVARADAAKLVQSEDFWQNEAYQCLRDVLYESGIFSGENLN